jgi:hypothetical protein
MYSLKARLWVGDKEPSRRVCNTCRCPLDNLGQCPRCTLRRVAAASGLRVKRRGQDLFREIDRIVAKSW